MECHARPSTTRARFSRSAAVRLRAWMASASLRGRGRRRSGCTESCCRNTVAFVLPFLTDVDSRTLPRLSWFRSALVSRLFCRAGPEVAQCFWCGVYAGTGLEPFKKHRCLRIASSSNERQSRYGVLHLFEPSPPKLSTAVRYSSFQALGSYGLRRAAGRRLQAGRCWTTSRGLRRRGHSGEKVRQGLRGKSLRCSAAHAPL